MTRKNFLTADEQGRFLDVLLTAQALKFGHFKTKSGRDSPYFMNFGALDTGGRIKAVAECYASCIEKHFASPFPILFGPAYKGISLAVAVAEELERRSSAEVAFSFNRKEVKDHGEGGLLVGRSISRGDKVLIIEDVLTGGTSIRESLALLRDKYSAEVVGAVVGVDRQEKGSGEALAAAEIEGRGVPVYALLNIQDILRLLYNQPRLGKVWLGEAEREKILAYQKLFNPQA